MSVFNKSYRIRTEVGKDTHLYVNLDRNYDILEIMSLKINQKNAYNFHTSNYGVIAGRVLANDAVGVPNAKVSVFISIDDDSSNDIIKNVLYPYTSSISKNKDNIRYNLLPNESTDDCHAIIGTFPEKQYMLDNDNLLEIFDNYYKFTTRTNNSGDYMIFGVPTGNQNIHVDIDLSDIGFLSQKPRDMVYKGYNIEQFESPNKFKYDTNLDSLTQVISQDTIVDVIPFWGDNSDINIGISRCDINIQYKFEPTCIFMGSVVSDTRSNGISKKCIPTPGMGAMDEITTGSGTIEMIRKTINGDTEEFQIKGTQLINGDGVWCYQIPMNLDYMITDEFGNMVPTNNTEKGIPTRTRVRFRISMQDFDSNNTNMERCKILVPHNPNVYSSSNECSDEIDYQFGTKTKDSSYRDLFWNGVYSVKSYIPRIQKGANWRNEKFTGFKRTNYYNDNNPIPYNNIRVRVPFMYTIICVLIKIIISVISLLNFIFRLLGSSIVKEKDDEGEKTSGSFISLSGNLCNENLDNLCVIPGINISKIIDNSNINRTTLLGMSLVKHYKDMGGSIDQIDTDDAILNVQDEKSIDSINSKPNEPDEYEFSSDSESENKNDTKFTVTVSGINVTDKIDYLIQCIEMNLAQEFKVIQFDFYNDWINGLIYIPRWMRNVTKKRTFLWGLINFGGKIKACNENFRKNRNIVQQCGLEYTIETNQITNNVGCTKNNNNKRLICHKSSKSRKKFKIFEQGGLVKSIKTLKEQYVYYIKPCEVGNKNVRLFSTDIILLGSVNECDKFGISTNLNELISSTYQLPPNMPLTDSDLEGNDYESKSISKISFFLKDKKKKISDINLYDSYVGINPMEDTGNYTEIAGINWDYNGPLQSYDESDKTKFYKPGGHFLGITCRNSETSVKTCVNLSRICEHGVMMSQRHELITPKNSTTIGTNDSPFKTERATVPSGLISKDEITNTNYRRLFATMNRNKLRTVISEETNYPVYDFIYSNPTNFGGELNDYVSAEKGAMNRVVKSTVFENEYEFTDDDYYMYEKNDSVRLNEIQIMRTGEYTDNEYVNFRFGLNNVSDNDYFIEKSKRYLIEDGTTGSFPLYDNSFYFYFGLHDGKTALDEFKKNYYSVCSKKSSFTQNDDNISITGITSTYDGFNTVSGSSKGTGTLSFYVKANNFQFGSNVILFVNLIKEDDETFFPTSKVVSIDNQKISYSGLKYGIYNITINSSDNQINEVFKFEVKQINIKTEINSVSFKDDVSNLSEVEKFKLENRREKGGYIKFNENSLLYENNGITIEKDIFDSKSFKISLLRVKSEDGSITIESEINNPLLLHFNNNSVQIEKNDNGEYMIPVPKEDISYNVFIKFYIDDENKPVTSIPTNRKTYTCYVGNINVDNVKKMDFYYNDISYNNILKNFNFGDNGRWWEKNISTESESVQWNLKMALFKNNLKGLHKINIKPYGGELPIIETICGMTESLETNNVNRNTIENVIIPTINYNIKRDNFTYQIKDNNSQCLPTVSPFVIPVIYKPFFIEGSIFYFSSTGKYYLYGNVYNGITWDYINEGFNECKINNVLITELVNITKSDMTMEISEEHLTNEKGGYDYRGENYKYNGRKAMFQKELDEEKYFLYTNKVLYDLSLSIGCSHSSYVNKSYINKTDGILNKINIETLSQNNKTYVRPIVEGNNEYTVYAIINSENEGYKYPLNDKNVLDVSNKLFRDLIDDKIASSDLKQEMISGINGYIDKSSEVLKGKEIYFIVIPNCNKTSYSDSSNEENKLKLISISEKIICS